MYPEDRVLVVYLPTPADFNLLTQNKWYRIPQKHAPKGLYAEYFAFYFGQAFGDQKWAIHYYAKRLGHELVRRIDLLPNEPNHPHAQNFYYKVQFDTLIKRQQPIISIRWRRLTFLHTTWDRFQQAYEINDLLLDGESFTNREYATLKDEADPPKERYDVDADQSS